jgi:hypothetical protein
MKTRSPNYMQVTDVSGEVSDIKTSESDTAKKVMI